jgi:hypothetical protein
MRLLTLLSLICPSLALALTPPPPPPPVPPPQVWIAPQEGLQAIRLARVDIGIRSRGFIAETTIEMVFRNPNARVLEGEFVFPLAAGQTVTGYALEVNGALREGVVVDKQTARVAFEDITRQSIDPGLAELTAGNVFRTRLYPIPARGDKRIRLHLTTTLVDLGDHWRYVLPMQFAATVEHLAIRAEAELAPSAPMEESGDGDPALRFEQAGTRWVAELAREGAQPRRELAFRIPKARETVAALEAVDPLEPEWRSLVALVDSGAPARPRALAPRRVALFYDASGSARERQRERERAALAAWVSRLGQVEVVLVPFRDIAEPPRLIRLVGGEAGPLLEAIDALALDGGSSYGAIDLGPVGRVDAVLIVGDGLSNFGPAEPTLTGPQGQQPPVHVLLAAQKADHARLLRLARAGGGQLIDLMHHEAGIAAQWLGTKSWRLLDSRIVGGECTALTPAAPLAVRGVISVTARCRGQGHIELSFGDGDSTPRRQRLAFGRAEATEGALADALHRVRAQAEIAGLMSAANPDAGTIARLGKRWGVVTPYTSLLVLDRIEDYVRYRVEPKEAELAAEYRRRVAALPKDISEPGLQARLDALLTRWQAFRDYHAAPYPGIETLLVPMAEQEAAAWSAHQDGGEARLLLERARGLAVRWTREAADPSTRIAWEREAAHLVLALEALRAQRGRARLISKDARGEAAEAGAASLTDEARDAAAELDDRGRPAERAARQAAMLPPPAPAAEPVASALASNETDTARADQPKSESPESSLLAAATPPARIQLSGWTPDAPYLAALRASDDPYAAYLLIRDEHAATPSFFLDVADLLREEAKSPALALRVLSNLAEIDHGNTALVRVLAYRLSQWQLHALAVPQFEHALAQRPEEPQSWRDLALALARQPVPDRRRAIELLWTVATRDWHGRFPDIELIALHEMNDVLAQAQADEIALSDAGIDPRFLDPVAVGLRVVLTWDADNTDIDLWVIDPSGDKAVYSQPRTRTGGHISRDFTQGYGPEVYTIRRPLPGTYIVLVNYFGDRRQSLTGPVTLQLEFQTRFGSAGGERVAVTRRLGEGGQTIEIGRFEVGRE